MKFIFLSRKHHQTFNGTCISFSSITLFRPRFQGHRHQISLTLPHLNSSYPESPYLALSHFNFRGYMHQFPFSHHISPWLPRAQASNFPLPILPHLNSSYPESPYLALSHFNLQGYMCHFPFSHHISPYLLGHKVGNCSITFDQFLYSRNQTLFEFML